MNPKEIFHIFTFYNVKWTLKKDPVLFLSEFTFTSLAETL